MRTLLLLAAWGVLASLCGCNQQQMIQRAEAPNSTPPAHFNEQLGNWR